MSDGPSDGRFDFLSQDFDAEASLQNPSDVPLAFPGVTAFKHLAQVLPLLPKYLQDEIGPVALPPKTSQKSDEKKANDAAKRAFLIQRTADYQAQVTAAAVKDPIQTLANRVRKGPLMLLKQVYDKTEQIDIVLRHTHGIRGVMRATLFGFDKYFNMLLADIQEIFVTRQLVTRVTRLATEPEDADAASAGDSSQAAGAERTRTAWKQVLKQRRLPRLILKGDQVVLVHRAVGNIKLPGSLGTRLQAQCDELSL